MLPVGGHSSSPMQAFVSPLLKGLEAQHGSAVSKGYRPLGERLVTVARQFRSVTAVG